MKPIAALAVALLTLPAHAGEQMIRLYGPDGHSVGTAVRSSDGSTRYYDVGGRSTGTSTTTPGGTTTIYDSRGRVVGRARGDMQSPTPAWSSR
jgi:hypothetical protein